MSFRHLFAATLCVAATPALADRIEAEPRTDHVTVFPQGASIRWNVDLAAAPAGTHQLVLPGLPAGIDPSSLRIEAEGARVGSVSLQTGRPEPGSADEPASVTEARARLREAQAALVDFDHGIALKRAESDGWRERAAMIRDLMRGDARVEADQLQDSVDQAGGMIADHLARAAEALREADLLETGREDIQRDIRRAEEALAAVLNDSARETLLVVVEKTDEAASLSLTGFTDAASWAPDYDLRLDRDAGRIEVERGLVVTQSSGIDWQDVTLTLSTARPSGQVAPTEVPVWMPSIFDPAKRSGGAAPDTPQRRIAPQMAYESMADAAAPVVANAQLASIGMTVAYDYPAPVTIRDGADAMRLKLDQKQLEAEVFAQVAPRFDDVAYVVAETGNTLGEPILPGQATLWLDGAMVGQAALALTAPGDDLELGFGPIDGITAELRIPDESRGERGLIRRSNAQEMTELLILRNLTDSEWPLRVVDRVPVSRQDDLKIDWSADPRPTETDPDGRRGVLYWQDPLPAGETREITLTTRMQWPEGMELSR
ncbi:DUF4139 domain-containing protein [Paracoccus siganidrum]|uniref:Mucoidy inhibitor MuiA family protein n=1 Tax=Paracoccus siganidrum TaxID=1276757 RepID=A0A418ZZY9_9RHOB|nr:DUF4139 domain-containing protein [Paracoccus siganidrum]RJL06065.1 mucoidy inhibitor MuiA family protein [Paracoccus siganidrum]RMC36968.1 hypothetical protein C9E82_07980 [Paracoccus siganidrum]